MGPVRVAWVGRLLSFELVNRIPQNRIIDAAAAERVQLGCRISGDVVVWRIYASDEPQAHYCAIPYMVTQDDLRIPVQLLARSIEELREQLPAGLERVDADDPDLGDCIEAWI